jgi:hypothetical protein
MHVLQVAQLQHDTMSLSSSRPMKYQDTPKAIIYCFWAGSLLVKGLMTTNAGPAKTE